MSRLRTSRLMDIVVLGTAVRFGVKSVAWMGIFGLPTSAACSERKQASMKAYPLEDHQMCRKRWILDMPLMAPRPPSSIMCSNRQSLMGMVNRCITSSAGLCWRGHTHTHQHEIRRSNKKRRNYLYAFSSSSSSSSPPPWCQKSSFHLLPSLPVKRGGGKEGHSWTFLLDVEVDSLGVRYLLSKIPSLHQLK